MADILNLQVKDETLTNIISNNPFYINIVGSVNICLLRCGQEIENCNSVNFSTMTNYGKILVLNTDTSKDIKCNIKLAFDNNNDTLDDDGGANYKFEKAFFTVPSLHKLNGQIFDMETFLLFSSVQKNGTILYVCLCIFNTGTNTVKSGDPKLLNYTLLNELFSKNNTVPDMYGTNEINGIPNPVDISNFLPEEGSRNFYDYTHPLNRKVNFRIFQTPMYVSNDIVGILKSKLTPGNIYTNFRDYINKSLNPTEGLFFYFSEDLTNQYKSFKANANNPEKYTYQNISESIIEEQELHEKEEKFKKLENKKDIIVEEEVDDTTEIEIKKSELFNNNIYVTESNQSIAFITGIILLAFIINLINSYWINTFFPSLGVIESNDINNCLSELNSDPMKKILSIKFKYYFYIIIQSFLSIIVLILLCIYNINNDIQHHIYNSLIVLIFFLVIINVFIFHYSVLYYAGKLINISDNNFTKKENYLMGFILEKIKIQNLYNILISIFNEDLSPFHKYYTASGGGDPPSVVVPGTDNSPTITTGHPDLTNMELNMTSGGGIGVFYRLFSNNNTVVVNYFKEKFNNNSQLKTNLKFYITLIILIFIIGFIFELYFVSYGKDLGIRFLVCSIVYICFYIPYALLICIISNFNYIITIFIIIALFIALFIFIPSSTINVQILLSFSFFILSGLITFIAAIFPKFKDLIISIPGYFSYKMPSFSKKPSRKELRKIILQLENNLAQKSFEVKLLKDGYKEMEVKDTKILQLEDQLHEKTHELKLKDEVLMNKIDKLEGDQTKILQLEDQLHEKTHELKLKDEVLINKIDKLEGDQAKILELKKELSEKKNQTKLLKTNINKLKEDYDILVTKLLKINTSSKHKNNIDKLMSDEIGRFKTNNQKIKDFIKFMKELLKLLKELFEIKKKITYSNKILEILHMLQSFANNENNLNKIGEEIDKLKNEQPENEGMISILNTLHEFYNIASNKILTLLEH